MKIQKKSYKYCIGHQSSLSRIHKVHDGRYCLGEPAEGGYQGMETTIFIK